jgi:hypothetical protein
MADAANKLAVLFASEQNACNSINDQYADLSRSFAQELVRNHQVDTSVFAPSLVASALAPYSLTAKLSDNVKARLDVEVPKESRGSPLRSRLPTRRPATAWKSLCRNWRRPSSHSRLINR